VTDYSKAIAELSPEKQELLDLLLLEETNEDDSFPLSFAQQRLWFLDQLEPNSYLYNVSTTVHIEGRLDLPAFQRSFVELVRRHETLRTSFKLVDRQPVQVIADSTDLTISVVDLERLSEIEREQETRRLLLEEAQLPFDLEHGPLLRVKLLRVSDEDHVLVLCMHHIVSDGWSMGVLLREVAQLYLSFSENQPSPLSELPIQYADFVLWQKEWLQDETLSEHLEYWKKQLAGAPAVLELPADRPRPAVNTHRGAKELLVLPAELSAAVKSLSEREGVTLFMTLLAAFQTLLHRYSGQDEIVVGAPIANRNRAETEGLIGFFVNTLVLRTDFAGNPSFRGLLKRVRDIALGAYAHQDLPFEKLVEELQPERSLSHTPLFHVAFVFQNAPIGRLELSGLRLTPIGGDNGTSKFDLTLFLEETEQGIVGGLEYNTDLFAATTIRRMLGHYQQLLEGIVENLDHPVWELSLTTEAERRQLLEWNPTDVVYPVSGSLHEIFERQVTRTPDVVALVFENEQLTYAELNRRANQLARHLRALGVKAESRVGVMLERSVEMVVSLLAILKAGGAYLPLDPDYPQERLAFMLADAETDCLLTNTRLQTKLEAVPCTVICLDSEFEIITRLSDENLHSDISADNLAYVIYTSGSTGKPKGVTVTHGNVMRLFAATDQWFHFDEHDVWTLFHSYAFDFSVWELWGALLYGGRLIVVPYLVSRSPEAFHQLLVDEQVTVLNQTPSAFRQLIHAEQNAGSQPSDLALRLVIFGGEALEAQSLKPWFERHGDQKPLLVNMYGITETTVHVTYRPLSVNDLDGGSVIGRQIPDLQIYVLDAYLQPVPVGVAGEMYVGGEGVARGYLRQPELTATRFVPHPFSARPGERLYRTGDLARYLINGELEYLGRIDQQVKIRGFRIELGEIESVLLSHHGVRETVVMAREDTPGEKRLVAYLILDQEDSTSLGDIRSYLSERLPHYMVPSAFVMLDSLPLTTNGKVDRRALPAPDRSRPELERVYVAPSTTTEQVLVEVWAEALGIEQVGIHDNYFELGGDSIRSVGLLALARERQLDFSLQQLFQYQTIYELAREIDTTVETDHPAFVLIQNREAFGLLSEEDRLKLPAGLEDAYPLSMMQAGMLFHAEYTPDSSVYHNVTSFCLRTAFDEAALATALRQLIARHPVLRTSFNLMNYSEPLQLVHAEVELPLIVEDLRQLTLDQQQQALNHSFETEKTQKFDWRQAPLFRIRVERRTDETFQFTLTEHHAILDGWSVASLLSELFSYYSALLNGRSESAGTQLVSSFRDFVELERAALNSETSRRYWADLLRDSVVTTLPYLPEGKAQTPRLELRAVEIPISSTVSDGLKVLAQSSGVPLKSVLLAAHLRVMRLLSGQDDVLTGVISHGRPEGVDGERVAGLFLNTLPFRQRLSGGTWTDLVRQVFETELDMLPHRRYPLAQIQNEHGHSLLETFFNFINFHVYDAVKNSGTAEVQDARSFSDTNFAFAVEFSLDLHSSDVTLIVSSGETSLLTGRQLKAIGDYYNNTLQAMSADPFSRYESLCLLGPAERDQILDEWNQTETDFPEAQLLLHQWFEAQVDRTPDSLALQFADQQFTYRELNEKANQVAHHLRSLGVGPETRVGIMLTRSPLMLMGLLAVLKAGGAYVPLDPNYPQERLSFMLADAEVRVLVTEEHLLAGLPTVQAKVLALDIEWPVHCSTANLESIANRENLAYVIYTSGSTGTPKGVAITHRSASVFVAWSISFFTNERLQSVLASTSINFDLSVFELFVPLSVGGRIVLAENALQLPALDSSVEVQLINTVPSAIAELVRQNAVPASVRIVNLAGEALSRKLVQEIYAVGTIDNVINLYGPSEDTTYSTYDVVSNAVDEPVLIGRPVANTQVYLLDTEMQPVPIGVAGELYTAGEGLARGYLNRPELTAEKFVPNPFSKEPGARLYRTGDLARHREDGRIEYLARMDQQVKVRGFRIELGEIEAVLDKYSSVQQCVATVYEDESGDKRIVAYVVPHGSETVNANDLRGFLKEKLPEYMVPQIFVMLSELPRTPNGKIDRKRLPAPEQAHVETGHDFVAPRTQTEEIVAGILAEVLKLDRVGANDNFFDLGGHSLLATLVVSRIRAAIKVELPLRVLFTAPSVTELAQSIDSELRSQNGWQLAPIESTTRTEALPLSFAQERLWFLDQWEPGQAAFNISEAVRLTGPLNIDALSQALNEIVRRHESLRTKFVAIDGQAVQVIAPSLALRFPLIDLQTLPETQRQVEAREMARQEARRPFDLSQAPLLRVTLLRLGEEEHVVLFTMHHIISDAWSVGVFVNEVTALYQAFINDQPSPLPDLQIQYADFAHWQRTQLQDGTLSSQLDYWKKQLAGAPTTLELPVDRPRTGEKSFTSSKQPLAFTSELSESIKKLSRQTGTTMFMTLLAAFKCLLRHHSGNDDIVIGTDVANRNRVEVESLIGFFINQLVLRTDLSGNPSFADLLERVRETTLGAYAHQDTPFDRLVETLKVERSLEYPPLFQVKFVYQNAPVSQLDLQDLQVEIMGVESGATKVDLQLTLWEEPNGLKGWLEYNTQLFESSTITRLATEFVTLLNTIASQPQLNLSDLDQVLRDAGREFQATQAKEASATRSQKYKTIRRKAVSVGVSEQ
jgi:amino acid adenylation domain-containing protein